MDNRKIEAANITLSAMFPDTGERIEAIDAIKQRLGVAQQQKVPLLTTAEAAQEAGCTPKTLRSWEKRGIVRCIRITPRRVRWSLAGLQKRLNGGKEGPQ